MYAISEKSQSQSQARHRQEEDDPTPPPRQPPPRHSFMKSQDSTSASVSVSASGSPQQPQGLQPQQTEISFEHRKNFLSQYQTTCISKHYALNNQILAAFESHYRNELWIVAYQIGWKYLETALLEIPTHGYYYAHKWSDQRRRAQQDANRVSDCLQNILTKHNPPELPKDEAYKLQLLQSLVDESQTSSTSTNLNARDDYETGRAHIAQEIRSWNTKKRHRPSPTSHAKGHSSTTAFANGDTNTTSDDDDEDTVASMTSSITRITSTVVACGDSVASILCPSTTTLSWISNDEIPKPHASPVYPSSMQLEERSLAMQATSRNSPQYYYGQPSRGDLFGAHEPPPTLQRQQSNLQRALFLSGLQVDVSPSPSFRRRDPPPQPSPDVSLFEEDVLLQAPVAVQSPMADDRATRRKSKHVLSIQVLVDCYRDDFSHLSSRGRIQTSFIPTYQGRIPESNNGCTVIAPLLCIHHLHNSDNGGLPDLEIVDVIDEETPSLVPHVRDSLGLCKNAMIVPSDVHESLMEQGFLSQEQFVTVCGGNVFDEDHLETLLKPLAEIGPEKIAATFFFHQHVITILQMRQSSTSTTVYFDIIDSLPNSEWISPAMELYGGEESKSIELDHAPNEEDENINTTRTRCMDVNSLKASILWRACSALTEENKAYIDMYEWDESLVDFDPRVFQAFVWKEV